MRILYFDCFSGISGDMTLGALIDCGVDGEALRAELKKLGVDGYSLEITRKQKNGIEGCDVDVRAEEDHCGDGGRHCHRNLRDIKGIIDRSSLSDNVKSLSERMFGKLARAEAKIHGVGVDDVHFHEVGAVDSIIDMVGASICVDMLHIDKFVSSSVNTGMGFVRCQHGIIPVPAPATVELLKGVSVHSSNIDSELVTPTGAAIVSTLCSEFGPIPEMTIEETGYGCGKRDLEIPNLLRVLVGDEKKKIS